MRETIATLRIHQHASLGLIGKTLHVELLDARVLHIYHDPEVDKEAKILLKMKELEEIFEEQKELHYRGLSHA